MVPVTQLCDKLICGVPFLYYPSCFLVVMALVSRQCVSYSNPDTGTGICSGSNSSFNGDPALLASHSKYDCSAPKKSNHFYLTDCRPWLLPGKTPKCKFESKFFPFLTLLGPQRHICILQMCIQHLLIFVLFHRVMFVINKQSLTN